MRLPPAAFWLIFATVGLAFSQVESVRTGVCPGGGISGSGGGSRTEFVATFNVPQIWFGSIAGAPYSGRQRSHIVPTLTGGARVQPDSVNPMMYRDSMGRTRIDAFFGEPIPASNGKPVIRRLAQIDDPVAGYRYILDNVHQIAHRVVPCKPTAEAALAAIHPPSAGKGPGSISIEDLGTQTMLGVAVTGKRQTLTLAAGTYQGNSAPVTRMSESWHSVQYDLDFLSKAVSPDQERTTTLVDFSASEPDPTLFRVPPGYQVVDESATFTITIPYAH